MINYFIEKGNIAAMWLASKANRLRIQGARVELIAFIAARSPLPVVLLVESVYGKTWMPPQEGVYLSESFKDAFYRCVHDECGIKLPSDLNERRKLFHMRHIEYIDVLELPPDRWGERLVADDAVDTPLSNIRLKKKAYWAAIAIIKDSSDITPIADGREVVNVGWFALDKARVLIQTTNRAEKGALILKGLDLCQRHLGRATGGTA